MTRITETMLRRKVQQLNELTGNPVEYMNEARECNPGHYCLDGAYGGWQLGQICNTGGGQRDIFQVGFVSKRVLWDLINAFMLGIDAGRK